MKKYLPLVLILILAAILRLWNLDHAPNGLNADEAAIGYNAYSLLQTGRDEHGVSWPLEFRSFDDFKPPVYFYIVLPFVKFLGLSVWAVRLPSALLGILSVYLLYLLSQFLFKDSQNNSLKLGIGKWKIDISLLAAFLLAISPWHLHFSRGGWEVNAATTFLLLGLVIFYRGLKHPLLFPLASLSLVVCLYTYHSMRLVAPLLVIFLLLEFRKQLFVSKNIPYLVSSALLVSILLFPLVKQTITGSSSARFSGVSIFADQGPLNYVEQQRRLSPQPNALITKIKYNRYSAYTFDFLKNLVSHYSPDFLFINGDAIARSRVPGFGQSYLILLPFFYLGLGFVLFSFKKSWARFVLFWLLISPIAAALTFQSPHALRAQNMAIPFNLTIALGLIFAFDLIRKGLTSSLNFLKRTSHPATTKYVNLVETCGASLLLIVTLHSFGYYLNSYYYRYPRETPFAWQYGFDQLSDYLKDKQTTYDQIIVTTSYDQPYILLAFYLKYPPALLQRELTFSQPDKFAFSTGTSFGKFIFKSIEPNDFKKPNTLIVVGREVIPTLKPIETILYPSDQPAFRLYSTNQNIASR